MVETALSSVLHQQCVHIRVWREDGVYVAKCLDIPGCVSQGQTKEEALNNINEAISLCLSVIREDAGQSLQDPEVEIIERPISQYLDEQN